MQTTKHEPLGKVEVGYTDDGLLGNQRANDVYSALILGLTERLDKNCRILREKTDQVKEPSTMALVHALRLLATGRSYIARLDITAEKIGTWKAAYEQWFKARGSSIPKKWRENSHALALEEFQLLEEAIKPG